jgi:DNA polymerase I-like protein with 3'-5' exonuclease and polymerase domains
MIPQQLLDEMCIEMIRFADNCINDKLGQILDCRSLVELSDEFETRIRQYFKPIIKANREAIRVKNQKSLEQILIDKVRPVKFNSVEDVAAEVVSTYNS